jgi:hypothetical protein
VNRHAGFAALTQQQRAVAALQLDYKLSTAMAGEAQSCGVARSCVVFCGLLQSSPLTGECHAMMHGLAGRARRHVCSCSHSDSTIQWNCNLKLDWQMPLPTSSVLAAPPERLRAVTLQRPSSRLQYTGDPSQLGKSRSPSYIHNSEEQHASPRRCPVTSVPHVHWTAHFVS